MTASDRLQAEANVEARGELGHAYDDRALQIEPRLRLRDALEREAATSPTASPGPSPAASGSDGDNEVHVPEPSGVTVEIFIAHETLPDTVG